MEMIETLSSGGKQSHVPKRYDLIEFKTLAELSGAYEKQFYLDNDVERSIYYLHKACSETLDNKPSSAFWAMRMAFAYISNIISPDQEETQIMNLKASTLCTLAEVFYEGSLKYPVRNYLLIPIESHLNHALNHLYLYLQGDTSEPHLKHALCRVFMAVTVYNHELCQ